MTRSLLAELLELSPAERIQLAEDLWDSIEPDEMPTLTTEQKQETERRYAEHIRKSRKSIQVGGCKSAIVGAL